MTDEIPTPRVDAEAYEYTPAPSEADEFYGRFPDSEEVVSADLARRLERELARQWQPIATAPENQSVLVFIPNAEHYGPGVYRAIKVNMGTPEHWCCTALSMGRDLRDRMPTHWMPLPEPPAT